MTIRLSSRIGNISCLGVALAAWACGRLDDCNSPGNDGADMCPSMTAGAGSGGTSEAGGSAGTQIASGGSGGIAQASGGSLDFKITDPSELPTRVSIDIPGEIVVPCESCLLQDESLFIGFSIYPARRQGLNADDIDMQAGRVFARDTTHFYVLGKDFSAVEMATGSVTKPLGSDFWGVAVVPHASGVVALNANFVVGEGRKFGSSSVHFLNSSIETSFFEGDTFMGALASDGVNLWAVGGVHNPGIYEFGLLRLSEGSYSLELSGDEVLPFTAVGSSPRMLVTENTLWIAIGGKIARIDLVDGSVDVVFEYSGSFTVGFQFCGGDLVVASSGITRFALSDASLDASSDASSEVVFDDGSIISSFACNDWGVFWTVDGEWEFESRLWGMAYGSSTPEVLMTGMTHPAGMIAEDEYLYWVSSGSEDPGNWELWSGSIHRIDLSPLSSSP